MTSRAVLTAPCQTYMESYLAACREYEAEGRKIEPGHFPETADRWGKTLEKDFENARLGIGLPEGAAPCATWWLVEDGVYIGTGHLRHFLTDEGERSAGHIDVTVRPSMRGKGYGTALLAQMLQKAAELRIDPVLVVCAMKDEISARVIGKNGGVMKDGVLAVIDGRKQAVIRYEIAGRGE